ncbi:Serine/threonine protein kinase [Handroanthus impetiginosus]|uniref:Serine/threonine protein kinase n=1 Tax=Handroanthus impetiginosus TaxID=429701 RepID=A0A2G9I9Y5_9LAMI|nr:Serine/threonine protein kinase [Handroanthus impetiginosus]
MKVQVIQNLTICFILIRFYVGEGQQFSNCNRLFSCGDIRDIGYPFWGGDRPPECGSRHLQLSCRRYNYATIDIGEDAFLVQNININNNTMTLARMDLLNHFCPLDINRWNSNSPFQYTPNVQNLTLFYTCSSSNTSNRDNFSCIINTTNLVAVIANESFSGVQAPNRRSLCELTVTIPVLKSAWEEYRRNNTMTLQEVVNKGFEVEYQIDADTQTQTGSRLNVGRKIGIGVGAAAFSAFIMCIVFVAYHRRYKKRYSRSSLLSRGSSYPSLAKDLEKVGVHIFDYNKLEEATDHFNPKRELGDGGYGAVYKGKLQDGRVVAVKRLYENHQKRVEQFMNEVEILTRLRHQNLVSLYGCTSCNSRGLLLVYEYIPNGTLADHLHGSCAKPGSLSWITRLNIAIETATALAYLHASDVIHRDIKTTNILLDNNFMVKVADFGLCRLLPMDVTHVSTAPQGTPGYVDPEYNEFYQLTEKSDVYSFGVVLIELISSKPAVDITRHQCEINLSTMAINKIQNRALHELVDPHLGFDSDYKVRTMIILVAELAFQCLQTRRDMRPQMQDVLNVLLEIQTKDYSTDVVDIPADDILLLKGNSPSLSPNSNSN